MAVHLHALMKKMEKVVMEKVMVAAEVEQTGSAAALCHVG